MTPEQMNWVKATAEEAASAAHVFPEMAAAEAALESSYGQSELAKEALNLFGIKQHKHPEYGTFNLPTREFEASEHKWVVVSAAWVEYPSIAKCFEDRIHTLSRLSTVYPNYARALTAPTPQKYVEWISKTWSTDPQRAEKVEAIYSEVFGSQTESQPASQSASPAAPPESDTTQTPPATLLDSTPAETGTDDGQSHTPPATSEAPATGTEAPPASGETQT
jgi:flagellum-specific peptidoglycan hydrolase FlgJ